MGCKFCDMVRFYLGTLLQGQMRITKRKSASNSVITGLSGLQCEFSQSKKIIKNYGLKSLQTNIIDKCYLTSSHLKTSVLGGIKPGL